MHLLLYDVATTVALPLGWAWIAASKRHRPLLGRFRPPVPPTSAPPIWVQACSVGEVNLAKSVLKGLERRWPDVPIVLTTSTRAGRELAGTALDEVQKTWFPFDQRGIASGFVRRLAPRALVLLETELWPAVLRAVGSLGIPTVVLNGRLSDKHFPRYQRARGLFEPVLKHVTHAGMQNREYADRFVALGGRPEAARVTGSIKFDGVRTSLTDEEVRTTREENGLPPAAPVLLFGSTRPGDEEIAAECWRALRDTFRDLRLVVAPRHSKRLEDALKPFDEPVLLRSAVRDGKRPGGERVLFVDTTGELVRFYGIATLAVVGGSFDPAVQGHNPIEPAALGTPTVFGPHMRNFVDAAEALIAAKGCRQVQEPTELPELLHNLLSSAEERAAVARRGREAILDNQGALNRSLDLVGEALGARAVPELGA